MLRHYAITPLLPERRTPLEEGALELYKASAKLSGRVHPVTRARIVVLLRNVNSYYSNLIEGIRTSLLDIEESLHELSPSQSLRRLQILHRQNIRAQEFLLGKDGATYEAPSEGVTSPGFLRTLHTLLFKMLDREFLLQRTVQGDREVVMTPGAFRTEDVRVGHHIPPSAKDLPRLLDSFHTAYGIDALHGPVRLIAAAASHHRVLWIHPFLEGNGRVARLFTDVYLSCAGLEGYGLWTMSRGFARREQDYKSLLAAADSPRQGDYDGQGALSEKGVRRFCEFFLETAMDQTRFMDDLLGLDAIERNITLYCRQRIEGHLVGMRQLPKESARILTHTFIHGKLPKNEVAQLINASERKARDITKLLMAEGLLETHNQKAPLTIGLPAHAVRFYFPDLCDAGAF